MVYQSPKMKNFLIFHPRKIFFQAHIQSRIDYASTLSDSSRECLLKPLKSLHRTAIKIILLKDISLTNDDYPKHFFKYNTFPQTAGFNALTYLVKIVSINHYSRNYSRKLNVPIPSSLWARYRNPPPTPPPGDFRRQLFLNVFLISACLQDELLCF